MSNHLSNLNTSYNQQFADGFNHGMQTAAQRFDIFIQILALTFLLKILLRFPPIQKKIDNTTSHEITEPTILGLDVLAFFITLIIYWALLGKNIIG